MMRPGKSDVNLTPSSTVEPAMPAVAIWGAAVGRKRLGNTTPWAAVVNDQVEEEARGEPLGSLTPPAPPTTVTV